MRLGTRALLGAVALLGLGAAGEPLLAQSGSVSSTLTLQVAFRSHSSLRVSSSTLQFDVTDPRAGAQTSIEYVASARTRSDGQVLLTVEPVGSLEPPVGTPGGSVEIAYEQQGGVERGTLPAQGPAVAGRWVGSGVRGGRLVFTLRGAGASGRYTMPVRFVLSLP